jgi:hypothetical protein
MERMQYHDFVQIASEHCAHEQQRRGQFMMNLLYRYRPDLSNKIPQEFDVFYTEDNQKIGQFLTWLSQEWDK